MTYFPPGGDQPPYPGQQPPFPGSYPGQQPQGPGYPWQAPGYVLPGGKLRPGRTWYLLALAIFAAGVAWLVIGSVSVASTVSNLQRVPLPAGGTVNLTHSGGYTIYYEGPGSQSGNFPAFHVDVTPASPGATVASLTRYGSVVTYDFGSHQGRAVLALRVTGPGKFLVTTAGAPASGADLAFGGSIGSGLVGAVLPAIPLIVLGFVGWLILLIVRIARKRSVQRGYY